MEDKFAANGISASVQSLCKVNARRLQGVGGTVNLDYTVQMLVQGNATENAGEMNSLLTQLTEISTEIETLTTEFVEKYKANKKLRDADWQEPDWVKSIEIKAFVVPDTVEVTDSSGVKETLTAEQIKKVMEDEMEEDGAIGHFQGVLVSSLLLVTMVFHLS